MPDDPLPIPLAPFNNPVMTYEHTQLVCRVTIARLERPLEPVGGYGPPMRGGVMEHEESRPFEPLRSVWPESPNNDPYLKPGPRGDPAITPGGIYDNTGPPIPLENFRSKVPTFEEMPHTPVGRIEMPLLHRHEDLFPRIETPEPLNMIDITPKREPVFKYKPPEPVILEPETPICDLSALSRPRRHELESPFLTAEPEPSYLDEVLASNRRKPIAWKPEPMEVKPVKTYDPTEFLKSLRPDPVPEPLNMLDLMPKSDPLPTYRTPKLFDPSELVPKREPIEVKPVKLFDPSELVPKREPVRLYTPNSEPLNLPGLGGPGRRGGGPMSDDYDVSRITLTTPERRFETRFTDIHAPHFPESHSTNRSATLLQVDLDTGKKLKAGRYNIGIKDIE